MQTVIIHVGLPGSGKTTAINNAISKHKENNQTFAVCSADHFFSKDGEYKFNGALLGEAHKYSQRAFQTALNDGIEWIYVDNTSLSQKERSFYYRCAIEQGVKDKDITLLVYVHPADVELSASRNIHGVSLEHIKKMKARMDLTTPGLYSVHVGKDGKFSHHFLGEFLGERAGKADE